MAFPGFYALGFYMLIVGAVIPDFRRQELPDFIMWRFATALLVSWVIAFVSFWLDLGNVIVPASAIVIIAILIRIRSQRHVDVPSRLYGHAVTFVATCSAAVAIALATGGFEALFHPIFQGWDPLVSWNRWAIELAENQYKPYNAAYPILIPSIWSLIYKAQGNADVWIIAKYTLIIFPLLLVLPALKLAGRGWVAALVLYVTFFYHFFDRHMLAHLFTGNMDGPVAVMTLIASLWALFTAVEIDRRSDAPWPSLFIAASLTGLAAITKQAGALMLAPVFYLCVVSLVRRQVSIKHVATALALAVMPLTMFMAMFLWVGGETTGNLSGLQSLAATAAGDSNQIRAAAMLLGGTIPSYLLIAMIGAAALNLLHLKSASAQIGILLAILAAVGFVIFADCCSYDARNGWWVISFLAASAIGGVRYLDDLLPIPLAKSKSLTFTTAPVMLAGIIMLALGSFAIGRVETDERLMKRQIYYQSQVVAPEISKAVDAISPIMGDTGKLIGVMQPIEWLPGFRNRFQLCGHTDANCVTRTIANHQNSVVMISRDNPVYFYSGFSEHLISERLMGSYGGFEFYGPFNKSHP